MKAKSTSKGASSADASTPPPAVAGRGKERIMAVAGELFYRNGIGSVGVDRIIEDAGVAKATLYKNFRSKDNLIHAYLNEKHDVTVMALTAIADSGQSAVEKIDSIFGYLEQLTQDEKFRGCAFVLAVAESPLPDSPAYQWAHRHKAHVRSVFSDILGQSVKRGQLGAVVEKMMILYDGALISSALQASSAPIHCAREMAHGVLREHAPKQRPIKA